MRRGLPDDLEVSWHESGHACAAVLRKVPFLYVTVEPSAHGRGACVFEAPGNASLEDHIIVSLAGPEAEAFVVADANVRLHLGHDDERLARLAAALILEVDPDDERERVTAALAPYRMAARRLVHESRDWLAAVVERLILYGTLDEGEVRRLRRKLRPVVRQRRPA